MHPRRRAALVMFLSFCVTVATAPETAAQSGPTTSAPKPKTKPGAKLKDTLVGDALAAFQRAGKLFEDSDFAGARAEYERAYTLSSDARLLFNAAACDKGLRRYARAIATLKKSLEAKDRLPPEHVTLVEDTIAVLQPFVGAITIRVDVPGATVSVDGEPAGTTPLAGPLSADVGERTVTVEKTGYVTQTTRLQLTSDAPKTVEITLVAEKPKEPPPPKDGRLRVQSDNATSRIFVDNKLVGTGTWAGSLPVGAHAVRVEREGANGYASTIDIRPGETRSLDVVLPENSRVPTWVWIAGGIAVAAGAGVAVGFAVAPVQYRGNQAGTLPPKVVPAGFAFGGKTW